MMGGMVASPTPTVPMSGDSITVMIVPVPGSARANMLAAIQPAVPPPTIAMRLICKLSAIPRNLDMRESHRTARRVPAGARTAAGTLSHRRTCLGCGGAGLELALYAEVEAATPVIIRERLIRPLQVRMLRFVGKVLHGEQDTDVLVEVVARLRVERPIRRCIDLVHLRDAILIRKGEG